MEFKKKKIHMVFWESPESHHSSLMQDFSEYLAQPCDTSLLLLLRKHKTTHVSAELLCYSEEHRWKKYQVFVCLASLWSNRLWSLTSLFLPILFPTLPQICPSTSVAAAIPPWPSFLPKRLRYVRKNFQDRTQLSGPQPPASLRTNQTQALGLAALNERWNITLTNFFCVFLPRFHLSSPACSKSENWASLWNLGCPAYTYPAFI